jgi:hypothetical protein
MKCSQSALLQRTVRRAVDRLDHDLGAAHLLARQAALHTQRATPVEPRLAHDSADLRQLHAQLAEEQDLLEAFQVGVGVQAIAGVAAR